jgi:hypothetical protein
MPGYRRRHSGSTKSARLLLVIIFFMLRIPDALCFYVTLNPSHPAPAVRANIVITALWTTAFLIAMWFRRRWARYPLIAFAAYVVFVIGLVIYSVLLAGIAFRHDVLIAFAIQLVFYLAAVTILVRSRDIKSFCIQR